MPQPYRRLELRGSTLTMSLKHSDCAQVTERSSGVMPYLHCASPAEGLQHDNAD